jgi:hypothetical protein
MFDTERSNRHSQFIASSIEKRVRSKRFSTRRESDHWAFGGGTQFVVNVGKAALSARNVNARLSLCRGVCYDHSDEIRSTLVCQVAVCLERRFFATRCQAIYAIPTHFP